MIASADILVSPPRRMMHLVVWVPDGARKHQRMKLVMQITAILHARARQ